MKKAIAIVLALAMLLPAVLAIDTGIGIGINVTTEKFPPQIWMCDHRQVFDDNVEPGRITEADQTMWERTQNYAFEGEQVQWEVLVMDKNGIDKINDVYVSVGPVQGNGQFIEANCQRETDAEPYVKDSCNARIGEEYITQWNPTVMGYYMCRLTVESPSSMHGEYWVTANVVDLDNLLGTMDENEYWFFNPVISLTLSGLPLNFGTVRPDTDAYSNTITVGNGAETSSGVLLDMFVTGTDFTDPHHSGAKCPTSNVMRLENLRYYATNGAYSTQNDKEYDPNYSSSGDLVDRNKDNEGYVNIEYGSYFSQLLYDNAEILQGPKQGDYYVGNFLTPGAEMSITFKLSLPMPCNGDFSDGSIYFWGEAI